MMSPRQIIGMVTQVYGALTAVAKDRHLARRCAAAARQAEEKTNLAMLNHVAAVTDFQNPRQRANYEMLARVLFTTDPDYERKKKEEG